MRLFHALSVSAVIVITTAGTCAADEPVGAWITFLSRRSGGNVLYKMRPDGSEVTPLFGGKLKDIPGLAEGESLYREPHWGRQSPDGKFFLDWAWDIKLPRDKRILPRFMIYLGRLDGGPVRAIAPDGGEYFAWSPDSEKFAYSRSWQFPALAGGLASSPTQILILGIDGAGERIVLERPYPEVWRVLDWSPDGKKLLLEHRTTVDMSRARFHLYELDLTAVDAKKMGKPVIRRDNSDDDSGLRLLVKEQPTWFLDGKYSPDGRTVAVLISYFQQTASGNQFKDTSVELATINVATSELKTVVKYPGERLWAPLCWSPNGKEILFSRNLKPGDRRENQTPARHFSSMAPDQGKDEPGWGIWAIRPDGSNARFLTTGWCADWR